jgi:hypothetical protein
MKYGRIALVESTYGKTKILTGKSVSAPLITNSIHK